MQTKLLRPLLALLFVTPELTAQVPPAQPQPAPAQPAPADPATQYPPPPQQPAQPAPTQPAPAYGQQPGTQPPPYAQPAPAEQPPYAQQPPAQQPPPSYAAQPPPNSPPPPTSSGSSFEMPDFSVRIDPLNWLFYGSLRFELEVELLEWFTVEASPFFVVSEQPVIFNSLDELHQSSGGLGPISGGSLVASFWLSGDSFNGTSLRVGLMAQSTEFETRALRNYPPNSTSDEVFIGDQLDKVTLDSSRLHFGIGSGRTWGWFTIAGGFGVEWDLGDHRRCFDDSGNPTSDPSCDDDQFQIALDPVSTGAPPDTFNLYDPFHPLYLSARLSLGVVFDD